MKALTLLVILFAAAFADWTGVYDYAPTADQVGGTQWQIQDGDMLVGQYDDASFFWGVVSADNTTVDGTWYETGDFQGHFSWTTADEGDSFTGTYWYGEFDNEYTNLGGWDAERVAAVVTADDAFADAPGESLTGVWTSTDGYTNYYLVDQSFFEGVYVSIDGTFIGHLLGHSFDGSNYVAYFEQYNLDDDTYFNWGNAIGYMHDDGTLEENWWSQLDAVSAHYWDGEFEGSNLATKVGDDVDLSEATGESTGYDDAEAAYYEAQFECELCEECPVCEDCPECEECTVEEGDDINTQINFDFAGLIPKSN